MTGLKRGTVVPHQAEWAHIARETIMQLCAVFGNTAADIQHIGSEQWHNHVDFRDCMNTFPEKAREYESLKQQLAQAFSNVQTACTDGKREYMRTALAEAKA